MRYIHRLFLSHRSGSAVLNLFQLGVSLTQEPEVQGSISSWPNTLVSLAVDSQRVVVSYWQKYVHFILINHLGVFLISLPRNS